MAASDPGYEEPADRPETMSCARRHCEHLRERNSGGGLEAQGNRWVSWLSLDFQVTFECTCEQLNLWRLFSARSWAAKASKSAWLLCCATKVSIEGPPARSPPRLRPPLDILALASHWLWADLSPEQQDALKRCELVELVKLGDGSSP